MSDPVAVVTELTAPVPAERVVSDRPVTNTLVNKEYRKQSAPKIIKTETVAEFLARGGQITKVAPASYKPQVDALEGQEKNVVVY